MRELLLKDGSYNNLDSPYDVTGEVVAVNISVPYVVLVYVEENKQIVSYIVNIEYKWMDPRLAYDQNATGEPYAILPSNLVWIPMINCYNCVDVHNMDMETQNNEIRIEPDGTVRLLQKSTYDTICRTQLGLFVFFLRDVGIRAAFPFDTQLCGIYFDTGMSEVNRQILYPEEVVYDLLGTPEWRISYDKVWINNTGFPLCSVGFKLVRNSEFYVVFLILPTMVVSSVSLAAILLPMDITQGEKVSMGITGLLGLTFLLSVIVQEVPRSKNLPVIGQWLIAEMFICILTLIVDEPVKTLKKRLSKRVLKRHPFWLTVLDYSLFSVVFLGNMLFTVLIFTILPTYKPIEYF